jgi:hypothetical protein
MVEELNPQLWFKFAELAYTLGVILASGTDILDQLD